jgi:hypothetical protein
MQLKQCEFIQAIRLLIIRVWMKVSFLIVTRVGGCRMLRPGVLLLEERSSFQFRRRTRVVIVTTIFVTVFVFVLGGKRVRILRGSPKSFYMVPIHIKGGATLGTNIVAIVVLAWRFVRNDTAALGEAARERTTASRTALYACRRVVTSLVFILGRLHLVSVKLTMILHRYFVSKTAVFEP